MIDWNPRYLFRKLFDRYDLAPAECLFIDDSYPNIRTASALGYKTHHFKSSDGLERHLHELNLLG